MIETIIEGNDLSSSQKRLLEEIDDFDLDRFCHNKGRESAAICLITPNQMILTDVYIKQGGYGTHFDTMGAIYKAIYDKDLGSDRTFPWQKEAISDGNIAIQLVTFDSSLIWLPEMITESQLAFLKSFNDELKEIKERDSDYFKVNPILFTGEDVYRRENLDEIIRRYSDERIYRTRTGKKK